MKIHETGVAGLLLLEPRAFADERGWFMESWSLARYAGEGVPPVFVQDNVSCSRRGTLRGLHYQHPSGQGKLVSVFSGEIMDVVADIRRSSPTFGHVFSIRLSDANRLQLYVPPGFAHGYMALSEIAIVSYKATEYYRPEHERGIRWNDPTLAVEWPGGEPLLSAKDAEAPFLADVRPELLPD